MKSFNQKAHIVIGLGFGDEGKGRIVDYLLSQHQEQTNGNLTDSIVVRFSGGHQVGHTVMIEGEDYDKHVHSNFGSGTLRGAASYFTEDCTLYLNTLRNEYSVLSKNGVIPKLFIHPLIKLTTPYDVAYNRVLEKRRGINKHGTVGLGFGATIERTNKTGYKLFGIDTTNPNIFLEKLKKIKNYYSSIIGEWGRDEIQSYHDELEKEEAIFIETIGFSPFYIKNHSFLNQFEYLIFEGSQGILLDQDHGIFPHVTYSNTTSKNALNLINKELLIDDIEINYVTRCYQTRHGEGWMSDLSEKPVELINNEHETCTTNRFQGDLRITELDYNLLNYSLDVDNIYCDEFFRGFKKNLMITCMDQRPDFEFNESKLNYKFKKITKFSSPYNKKFGI
ncbi:MAG: adenylosuccinate synthetase [bacterium]